MDTNLSNNAKLIRKIKKDVLITGLIEAYVEATPQFILQCSIILMTGNTSKYFGGLKLQLKEEACNIGSK